jgi:DUF4097 and DUF4098 domain-containing protein YvlB
VTTRPIIVRVFPLVLSVGLGWPDPAAARQLAAVRTAGPHAAPHAEQSRSREAEQADTFKGTYRVGEDGALDLFQIAGDVHVTGGRGSEIRIEAIKRVRHRDADEARRLLEALRIEVTQVGSRVEVRTVYPRTSQANWNGSVDYTISVPTRTSVALKTVSGDISVNEVSGEVRAETVSGNIELVSTPNLAAARTVSGDVRAREISAAALTLASISGTIDARALKVRTLEATSVSGDIRLGGLQAERLMAKTLSGDIVFDGSFQAGGRYEFNAHSGDVRLLLPDTLPGFDLDASTFSGSVRSDFPIAVRSFGQTRGRSARALRGTYGDASVILSARSFSGEIVITKR